MPGGIDLVAANPTFTEGAGKRADLWITFSRDPGAGTGADVPEPVRPRTGEAAEEALEQVEKHHRRPDKHDKHIADWKKAHSDG